MGFKDDFEVFEVEIDELPTGTGNLEEATEILENEEPVQLNKSESQTRTYRVNTGFLLGIISVGLSILSLCA